jgi:molybdopterin-guanine dinucleotide biosynthesis protein A
LSLELRRHVCKHAGIAEEFEERILKPVADSIVTHVTGVILAGGKARRMGGQDKGLVSINDRPMIAYAIDALRPQVSGLLINANRNRDSYARFGYPIVADAERDFLGPLAGCASGMLAASTPYIAVAPCDSPLLCGNLVQRLYTALTAGGSRIAVAHDGRRLQPVFALLDCTLLNDLTGYLADSGRKIDQWYDRHGYAIADCSDVPESFLNINAPADKQSLEDMLAARADA